MKLYEISAEYERAFDELAQLESIDEQTIEDSLAAIKGDFRNKANSLTAYIKNIEANVDAIKSHEKKWAQKRKILENRIASLKDYLRQNMERCKINKIESPLINVNLLKPQKVVHVYDDNLLPDDYVKVTRTPEKALIKRAINDGYEVPGATLIDGKPGIKIS